MKNLTQFYHLTIHSEESIVTENLDTLLFDTEKRLRVQKKIQLSVGEGDKVSHFFDAKA